jgi:hypothetical protein
LKESTIKGMGWAEMEGAGQAMEGAVGAHQQLEDQGGGEELGAIDLPRTGSPPRLVVVRS